MMMTIPRINCSVLARTVVAIGLTVLSITACGESAAPRVPGEVVSNVTSPLSARVGFAVVPTPAVTVRDDRGAPLAGVPVFFTMTRGNGELLGDSAVTNAEGIAAAISWRLGRVAGLNTLTATVSGIEPVAFDAIGLAGEPWSMAKVAGDNQTILSGTSLPVRPAVVLRDVEGNPVPNATVSFIGEDVTGATQVTNSAGVATVGNWSPRRPGSSSLEATHTLLFRQFFRVTVLAGPPAIVTKVAGDGQTAQAGTAVSRVPEVTVRDANQNLLPAIPVAFTVESGGGSVVNGNQITNWEGSAGPSGWIMGSAGPQVLRVTVEGVEPVFFTGTSLGPP